MKLWIPMIVLSLLVSTLCVWDSIFTSKVFNTMESKSTYIYETLLTSDISNKDIQTEIINLNDFWTRKMDTLSISISRKDLQPVSDYLQYLHSSIYNNNHEDAITYSRLLKYNIEGLKETNTICFVNLL